MNIAIAVVIIVACSATAVGAMLVVRRTAPDGSYSHDGDRAAGVFGVLATGFSVLLGFVVFLAFASYDAARTGAEDEALIVADYDKPVFVFNYPKEAKAFYMKENPDDPRTVLCDDLLAPEGFGEIIGGSQREDDYDKLLKRIHEEGLPVDAYGWYLELRKYGTFVHSGFGLGLERTVAWICGLPHIREVIAFPRMMHRLRP